jgi:RNA polymerase I-specific transcription initiation factor RRN6
MLSIEGLDRPNGSHRIVQLHLDDFDYKERGHEASRQGRTYLDRGVRFYLLTAVSSDLSVHQITLYNSPNRIGGNDAPVEHTSWIRTIKRPQCQWKGLVNDLEADIDFVRPDGMVNGMEPHLKRPCQPPKPIKRQVLGSPRHLFDFGSLYEALHEAGAPLTGDETQNTNTVDVAVVVQEAERLLWGEITLAAPPLGTL